MTPRKGNRYEIFNIATYREDRPFFTASYFAFAMYEWAYVCVGAFRKSAARFLPSDRRVARFSPTEGSFPRRSNAPNPGGIHGGAPNSAENFQISISTDASTAPKSRRVAKFGRLKRGGWGARDVQGNP